MHRMPRRWKTPTSFIQRRPSGSQISPGCHCSLMIGTNRSSRRIGRRMQGQLMHQAFVAGVTLRVGLVVAYLPFRPIYAPIVPMCSIARSSVLCRPTLPDHSRAMLRSRHIVICATSRHRSSPTYSVGPELSGHIQGQLARASPAQAGDVSTTMFGRLRSPPATTSSTSSIMMA